MTVELERNGTFILRSVVGVPLGDEKRAITFTTQYLQARFPDEQRVTFQFIADRKTRIALANQLLQSTI